MFVFDKVLLFLHQYKSAEVLVRMVDRSTAFPVAAGSSNTSAHISAGGVLALYNNYVQWKLPSSH